MALNIREDLPEAIKILLQKQGKELICSHFPDGRFQFVSNSCKNILGYMPGELEGKDPYDFIHPDDKGSARANVHEPPVSGQKDNITELRFRRKNGVYIWLQTITQPLFNEQTQSFDIYSSSRDVTCEVENRQKLERLERLFNAVSKLANIGGWELDLNSKERFWTPGVFDIYERDPKEFIDFNNNYKKKDRQKLDEAITRANKEGVGFNFNHKMKFISDKGTQKWIQTMGEVSDRDPNKLFGAILDISESQSALKTIKKQKNDLQKLKTELEVKNQFLLEFSQIIAHNLRSPVANIKSISNLMDSSNSLQEKEVLNQQIKISVDHMNVVFEDMMDALQVIQNTGLKRSNISVKSTVKSILKQLEASFKEVHAEVVIDIDEGVAVDFHKMYFESILLNFLSNCIKYRDPNKTHLLVKISAEITKENTFISVADNGLGLDLKKHGRKLFGLRKTFHRHKDARGLGLFMSRNQAQAMGAKIEVVSEVGEGSVFTLII